MTNTTQNKTFINQLAESIPELSIYQLGLIERIVANYAQQLKSCVNELNKEVESYELLSVLCEKNEVELKSELVAAEDYITDLQEENISLERQLKWYNTPLAIAAYNSNNERKSFNSTETVIMGKLEPSKRMDKDTAEMLIEVESHKSAKNVVSKRD